jgi:OOP family OmpA-OmpF porin
LALAAFVLAAGLALTVAFAAVQVVESRAVASVRSALVLAGLDWAEVSANGLTLILTGTAPDEAARARALAVAGGTVEPAELQDRMEVAPSTPVAPPRFSVEILRNADGIQLIGLVPSSPGRAGLVAAAAAALPDGPAPADMLEEADYAAPEGWDAAVAYAGAALALLPRAKISVAADGVAITANADSLSQKEQLEERLSAAAPKGLPLKLAISAPRPVLTPFTLRFVKDGGGALFDACAADTEAAATKIEAAGRAAGATVLPGTCTVGMGVPSPRWAEAAVAALDAVKSLKVATVTFSDADVSLLAGPGVTQADFDEAVGRLRNVLPDVFSLDAKLQVAAEAQALPQGPAEFTAVLAPDTGRIVLRGALATDLTQGAIEAVAKAKFGLDKVLMATRIDPSLPQGWPGRVLTGLSALALLHDGQLSVKADTVTLKGNTGSRAARARITQILSEGLGQGQNFSVDVTYVEDLDPLAALPTPEECLARVNAVMATKKIGFDPGSAAIDSASAPVMDAIAAALKDCTGLRMEIGGHTDAQGSEAGNKALSQARAEAVMVALQRRDVDVSAMRAVGYGESRPIADNSTDAGREANRRIEFTLIGAVAPAVHAESGPALTAGDAAAADGGAVGGGAVGGGTADAGPSLAPQANTVTPKPRPSR